MLEVWGSLPLLVVYPLLVGLASYRMARQMRYQNKQLEAMSGTEGLGRMLTRLAWERMVAEEFELCRRNGLPSCLLLVGIDDLPRLNQRHGYPKGDEVIRSIAVTVRNALREHDIPGRLGGGEFGALLSGSDEAGAMRIAEHIRRAVASSVLEKRDELRASVSVGVAPVGPGEGSYRDWILAAERALRAAREKGADRVELRPPD
jgi:diguanylate cyclase